MVPHDQFTAVNIGDRGAGFLADEQASQVVPDTMGVDAAVHVAIENSARHPAQVEGDRAEDAVLGPAQVSVGIPRQTDNGGADIRARRWRNRRPISTSPSPPDRLKAGAARLMSDDGCSRPSGIEGTRARCKPGYAAPCVRRAIERIKRDDDVTIGMAKTGLFGEHAETGPVEHVEGGRIGNKVTVMLAGSLPRRSPVAKAGECTRDSIGYGVEHVEKSVVPHDPPTVACETMAIREAGPDDLDEICALIRELADYELLSSDVVFDRDVVGQHLFGPKRVARVLMVEDGDPPEIAGFALWYPTFSTFLGRDGIWLEDLYVRPARRGRGLGLALVQHLRSLTSGRVEWAVLDWNESAIRFYRSLGADPVKGWIRYRWDSDSGMDKKP